MAQNGKTKKRVIPDFNYEQISTTYPPISCLLLAAVLLVAACTQDDSLEHVSKAEELLPISFNIVGDNVSKAGEIGAGNIKSQHFRVWAYSVKSWNRDETPYMKDVDIHFDPNSNGGEWVYTYDSQKAYWPKDPYTTLNFYAECPATGEVRFFGSTQPQDTLTAPYTTNASALYSIKKKDGSIKADTDLMIAWAVEQQNKTVNYNNDPADTIVDRTKKVQMTFHHALSELRFKITTANKATRAVVRSVTLGNVASLRLWHITNSYSESLSSPNYGVANVPLTFDAALKGSVDIANDTVMLNAESPLFLPPQSVACYYQSSFDQWSSWRTSSEMYLALDCDVWLGEKKVWDGSTQGLLYLPFYVAGSNGVAIQQVWQVGKRYTYLINLSGGFNYDGDRVITTTTPITIKVEETSIE